MPTDDHPFDALEKQLRMESLSVSPATKIVREFISLMPLKWPFDRVAKLITGYLAADSVARIRLMLETCMSEVRKHEDEIRRLRDAATEEESRAREEALRDLVLDAAHKAESTRAKDRVRRIGLILANAVVEAKQTEADEVEEMMRVAMELSDHDIEFSAGTGENRRFHASRARSHPALRRAHQMGTGPMGGSHSIQRSTAFLANWKATGLWPVLHRRTI